MGLNLTNFYFFREAIKQGADYIECDVEVTKDLKLVCSHEPWISEVIDQVLGGAWAGWRANSAAAAAGSWVIC